jgi:hypothetical protein
VVSELERRKRREGERTGNPYLYFSLGIGFVIAAAALIGKDASELRGQQRAVAPTVSNERKLLSAIRDNGGSITPAEAAMETSLTGMLSELAGDGHLAVNIRDGALFYSLPGRSSQELEGR